MSWSVDVMATPVLKGSARTIKQEACRGTSGF
jgi:hypothetical protein